MDTTQETRYHREVRATLDQVVELLDKQALVKELSSKQATHQQGLVETLVVRQQAAQIERRIEQLHPADLAFLIEGLPPARRTTIWDLVGRERRGAVLIELSDAVRGSLFAEMQEREIIGAVEHLASDDIADLVPSLPPDVVLALLRALDGKDRTEVQTVLSFPPAASARSWSWMCRASMAMYRWTWRCARSVAAAACPNAWIRSSSSIAPVP